MQTVEIDFSDTPDPDLNGGEKKHFAPLPEGDYFAEIVGVEEKTSSAGNLMWNLTFKVIRGEYAGRLVWDRLVITHNSKGRNKLVLKRLGFDVSGKLSLAKEDLKGRQTILTVLREDYIDDQGRNRKRNVVPFDGYTDPNAPPPPLRPGETPPPPRRPAPVATPSGTVPVDPDSDIPF